MFGTNQFGSAYFAQGPSGIVVVVLFGSVLIATLVSTNPTLTADSSNAEFTVANGNAALTADSTNATWIIADGNGVRTVEFLG